MANDEIRLTWNDSKQGKYYAVELLTV